MEKGIIMNKPSGIFDRAISLIPKFGGSGADGGSSSKKERSRSFKATRNILIVTVAFLALYYPVGSAFTNKIYDNTHVDLPKSFDSTVANSGSRAVGRAIQLLRREIYDHQWTPNDPFFYYTILLDNMPNYQKGIISAVSRFTEVMRDDIGRTRGSSQEDTDLKDATGRFKIDPTLYTWQPSVSLLPQASAETQFKQGILALEKYNRRLANGDAIFDTRADNFMALLERVSKDLGSASATIDEAVDDYVIIGWLDRNADDTFFQIKGRLYSYCMILQGATSDFDKVINEKNLGKVWEKMLVNLCRAAELEPLIISNGDRNSFWVPSHLSVMGFDLLRARTQLKEAFDILLK